ncbi:unnamed protein product, partial [marine sediment metagenome]
ELSKMVETNDEWITSRTGIKQRRISSGEKTYQMATKAAKEAIENAGIEKEEIDMIILATISPDFFMPSTANLVQAELGLDDIPNLIEQLPRLIHRQKQPLSADSPGKTFFSYVLHPKQAGHWQKKYFQNGLN